MNKQIILIFYLLFIALGVFSQTTTRISDLQADTIDAVAGDSARVLLVKAGPDNDKTRQAYLVDVKKFVSKSFTTSGDTLFAEGRAILDLNRYLDNTDAQDLSKNGDILSLSGSSSTIDLSEYSNSTVDTSVIATKYDLAIRDDNLDNQFLTGDKAMIIVAGQSNAAGSSSAGDSMVAFSCANVYVMGEATRSWQPFSMNDNNVHDNSFSNYPNPLLAVAREWQRRIDNGASLPDLYVLNVSDGARGFSLTTPTNQNTWNPFRLKGDSTSLWDMPVVGVQNDNNSLFELLRDAIENGVEELQKDGARVVHVATIWNQYETDAQSSSAADDYQNNIRLLRNMIDQSLGVKDANFFYWYPRSVVFTQSAALRTVFDEFEKAESYVYRIDPFTAPTYVNTSPNFGVFADAQHYDSLTQEWGGQLVLKTVLDTLKNYKSVFRPTGGVSLWEDVGVGIEPGNSNVRITPDGNSYFLQKLSIGTSSNSGKLHVLDSGSSQLFLEGSGNFSSISFFSSPTGNTSFSDGTTVGLISKDLRFWNYENADIYFGVNGAEVFRLNNDGDIELQGDVGINTNNPIMDLHIVVDDSDVAAFESTANFGSTHYFNAQTGNTLYEDGFTVGGISRDARFWNYENADMYFGVNGVEMLRIDNAGKVHIKEDSEIDGALQLDDVFKMTPTSTAPVSPASGWIYFDDGTNRTDTNPGPRYYNGTSWVDL